MWCALIGHYVVEYYYRPPQLPLPTAASANESNDKSSDTNQSVRVVRRGQWLG